MRRISSIGNPTHTYLLVTCLSKQQSIYSSPLKGHSREDTPLERTQIIGNQYHECM